MDQAFPELYEALQWGVAVIGAYCASVLAFRKLNTAAAAGLLLIAFVEMAIDFSFVILSLPPAAIADGVMTKVVCDALFWPLAFSVLWYAYLAGSKYAQEPYVPTLEEPTLLLGLEGRTVALPSTR